MLRRILVAVLVIGLAGCSSVGSVTTTEPTVTPAAVPDANASQPGTVPAPPGISGGTVVDVQALTEAHARVLVGESYTWEKRVRRRGPDGQVEFNQTVRATVNNATNFRYDRRTVGVGPRRADERFSVYADGTDQYIRLDGPRNDVRYVTTPVTTGVVIDAGVRLEAVLSNGTATVERIATGEGPRFLVRTDGTVRAVVRPDGLIERLRIDSGRLTYRGTVNVGPVTVEPPAWLSIARERTDTTEDG